MHRAVRLAVLVWAAIAVRAQTPPGAPSFEVASVKPSPRIAGHDGSVATDPVRFSARNATLKRLIFEAWQVPYSQIRGGPPWLDNDEYDIEAKTAGPVSVPQLRLMLRALLAERFHLATRSERKEARVYVLTVAKDGPRLQGGKGPEQGLRWRFHGDLSQFANVLAIQLTIPLLEDPGTPSRAQGSPIPVVNRTGIEGTYDLSLDLKPDPGAGAFTVWQRALREQLGLRLESQNGPIDVLVIEHAERIPSAN